MRRRGPIGGGSGSDTDSQSSDDSTGTGGTGSEQSSSQDGDITVPVGVEAPESADQSDVQRKAKGGVGPDNSTDSAEESGTGSEQSSSQDGDITVPVGVEAPDSADWSGVQQEAKGGVGQDTPRDSPSPTPNPGDRPTTGPKTDPPEREPLSEDELIFDSPQDGVSIEDRLGPNPTEAAIEQARIEHTAQHYRGLDANDFALRDGDVELTESGQREFAASRMGVAIGDVMIEGGQAQLTDEAQRERAASELGVPVGDIVLEGDQARLSEEARIDQIRHEVAADNENIYPGEVRVETVEDSGRFASERPVTGDEASPEEFGPHISLSTSAEDRIITDQVAEAEGVDPGRIQIDRDGGEPQISIEDSGGSGNSGGETSEQFGDFDWSMGLGGPEDEVENAVDSLSGRARDFARPKAEKLFSEDVAGESAGHWALSGLGFEQRADQYDSFIRGAGVGVSAGVAEGVASVPGGALESAEMFHEVRKNPETATEIPGATADVASQSYEMAKERPGETIGSLVGAYALGGAPGAGWAARTASRAGKTAKNAGGSAVRRSIDRVDSGDVLNTGRTDRGQLDLTPPSRSGSSSRSKSGDSGSNSGSSVTITGDDLSGIAARSDPTRGGRYPSGTSGSANVDRGVVRTRDTADTPSGGTSTSLGYRTASTEAQTAAKAPASATRTGTQTAVQTDRLGLVSGALSRMQAASSPGWLAAGQVPSGDVEDLPTQSDAEDVVMPSMYGEQPATEEVGVGGLGTDIESDPMVDDAQEPALSQMSVSDTDEDTVQGNQQRTPPDTGWLMEIGQQPRSSTASTSLTTPVPATPGLGPPDGTSGGGGPGRPRSRDPDLDSGGSGSEAETGSFDFGFDTGSDDPTVGWLDETVTDIGLGGTEMPGVPGGSSTGGDRASGDLPTTQLLEGDEDVEAAADLFSFGGSGDELEGFAIGGGSNDDEGWFEW